MKKLREQRQTLQDAESLIHLLKDELDLHRNLLYRMHLKHGNELQDGEVIVPDNLSFHFDTAFKEAELYILDSKDIKPLKTTYERILEKIKDLEGTPQIDKEKTEQKLESVNKQLLFYQVQFHGSKNEADKEMFASTLMDLLQAKNKLESLII